MDASSPHEMKCPDGHATKPPYEAGLVYTHPQSAGHKGADFAESDLSATLGIPMW